MNIPALAHKMAQTPSVRALLNASPPLEIEGPEGSAAALLISIILKGGALSADNSRHTAASSPRPPALQTSGFPLPPSSSIVVVPTDREACDLACDLETFGCRPVIFPWWGSLPYREAAPLSAVFGERTRALASLTTDHTNEEKPVVVIAPERAFLTPLPPPDYFRSLLITVTVGDSLDTQSLAARLVQYGYTRVPRVQVHSEFALRGEVLDIFQAGDDAASRILFDFDTVESIRRFEPESGQGASGDKLPSLVIRPLKEVVWDDGRKTALAANFPGTAAEFPDFGDGFPGEEIFYPLAFDAPATLLDYLDKDAALFYLDRERLANAQAALEAEYDGMYRRALREKPVPPPEKILLKFNHEPHEPHKQRKSFSFMSIRAEGENRFRVPCDPPRSFFGNIDYLREEFAALLKNNWTIVVAAESDVQAARMSELLREGDTAQVGVVTAPLQAGFALPEAHLLVVQENEIFGRRKKIPRSLSRARSRAIDTFVELNPGDYIVHLNYGIGLFKGIERIRAQGHERDYVKLEYLDDETIFVPIEQADLVQRYIGNEGEAPRLDRLGSKSWENRKGRVSKSVEDIAEKLLALYSKRRAAPGFPFPRDTEWQTMFEAAFPFEETADQLRCVEEIKMDMEAPHPMDRLVCGDVGYGKTEVAVRACFKAIMGGKQCAFLAPTTILAEQHYENFVERFRNFPVRVAMLSRLVSGKETRLVLEAVHKGGVDLLVGTHRIIQKDVVFRDLGLLVIDEEQRFGVKDKERLKELKTNVDCLTLSATPIPRTLHMSLLKIRDMSLLATPPANRQPIETSIGEWDAERIAAAIRAEVERGGQVFYLHNRIESLRDTRMMLERLVPEMLIETAHGQMAGSELEDVMHRFIHGGFHVLVSTTIIENGIDIPNVNTIIIDRADRYGVSQLYQLRGRVGRSDRAAKAFLFYPKDRALSEIAMKRLQVVSDFTELGSGFKIAMKDMEIRGAGNLLGREQSGDIYSVGFDLYLRLLDEAIRRLENEHYEAEAETLLELEYSGFIPDSYIDGPQEKMEVYKKIASVRCREELEALHAELIDRFGPPPDEAASLLALAEIRILCRALSVASLKEKGGEVRAEFSKVSKVNIDRLVRLMKEGGGRVKLDPHHPNVVILKTGSIGLHEKSEFLRERLAALAD